MSDPDIIGEYESAVKNMDAVTGTTASAHRRLCDARNALVRQIIAKLGIGEKIVSSSGSTGMLTKACLQGDALVIWLAVSDDKMLMDYAYVRAAREICDGWPGVFVREDQLPDLFCNWKKAE